jgi:hypothetical protein
LGPAGLAGAVESAQVGGVPVIAAGDTPFINVEPPAPAKPQATVYEGTIDPIEVKRHGEALAKLLPPAQPFDARTVSLQTTFDAEKLRAIMTSAPSDGTAQALPRTLWESRVEIVDVQWIREERAADGSWTNPTVVPPLPGRPSLRDVIAKQDFQPGDLRTLLEREAIERAGLRRPSFYSTISGPSWVWPSMAASRNAEDVREKVEAKTRQLRGLREEIKRLENQINAPSRDGQRPGKGPGNRPGGRQGQPPAPPPGGGGGAGGGGGGGDGDGRGENQGDGTIAGLIGSPDDNFQWPKFDLTVRAQGIGGGGGGGGGAGADGGTGEQDESSKRRQENERKALENARKQLETKKADAQKIIGELLAMGFDESGAPIESGAAFSEPTLSLGSSESVQVTLWGHDATARSGLVYRYKARVHVTNPFFGRTENLPVGRQNIAKAPTLISADSEWSTEIELAPSVTYFVTSASPAGGPLGTSAKAGAELFEFFYGYWRKVDVVLSPGDAILADLTLPELNTFELPAEVTPGTDAKITVKPVPLAKQRAVSAGAYFIDTAPMASDSARIAAILRSAEGDLHIVVPNLKSAMYRHLADSAAAGKNAQVRSPGQVAPKPEQPGTPDGPESPSAPANRPPGGGFDSPTPPRRGQ